MVLKKEVQEERGGLKEKGCREKKECIERKRWRDTWYSKIQQCRLCLYDETRKLEKGATTGNTAFRLQYTLLIAIIQLMTY